MQPDTITVVSGLPRSGTSMMMRMLTAGGMAVLADNLRAADEDNPHGYFEFERVKQIEQDTAWLADARGKAVKLISALLVHLPPTYTYKVIFMRRHMAEILASQRAMLEHRGAQRSPVSDERMAELFAAHLKNVEAWMKAQPNLDYIDVSYNDCVADPAPQARRVNAFLDHTLDVAKMIASVDRSLHRNRAAP